jgi:hypothetical protein
MVLVSYSVTFFFNLDLWCICVYLLELAYGSVVLFLF